MAKPKKTAHYQDPTEGKPAAGEANAVNDDGALRGASDAIVGAPDGARAYEVLKDKTIAGRGCHYVVVKGSILQSGVFPAAVMDDLFAAGIIKPVDTADNKKE